MPPSKSAEYNRRGDAHHPAAAVPFWGAGGDSNLFHLQHPNVPVPHGVPVILQMQEGRTGALGEWASGGALGELDVVVNFHAVVEDGHASVLDFFAVLELRGGEIDVVSLP